MILANWIHIVYHAAYRQVGDQRGIRDTEVQKMVQNFFQRLDNHKIFGRMVDSVSAQFPMEAVSFG